MIDRLKVKRLMLDKGVETQTELAKQAGIHFTTLSQMMSGRPFRSDTLQKLADFLGVSPGQLLKEHRPDTQALTPALFMV